MFDITVQDFSKAAEVGHTFDLKLPTGADSGATLTILGELSPTVKAYGRRKWQEYQLKDAQNKRKGREATIDLDEAEEVSVESALVRLVDWNGITDKGVAVPFSKEKAAEILKAHSWIREQIMQESADVLNFTPKTQKT